MIFMLRNGPGDAGTAVQNLWNTGRSKLCFKMRARRQVQSPDLLLPLQGFRVSKVEESPLRRRQP